MSLPSVKAPAKPQLVQLPLAESGQMHLLTRDYLLGKHELEPYYEWPLDIKGIKEAIEGRKNFPVDRKLLVEKLSKKYEAVVAGFEKKAQYKTVSGNLKYLSHENTFTVTTGHQLSLFTGPLYFVYKIISTIKYAAQLNKALPDYHFVPVYWMASEDHDFEEISQVHFWGKEIRWGSPPPLGEGSGVRGPAGRLTTKGIAPLIEELEGFLDNKGYAAELIALFKKAYLEHTTLAEATFYLVNELFGKYGLVIMDADDSGFKAKLAPVLKKDIFDQAVYKEVQKTSSILEREYKLPVNPREINVFYLKDNLRERIIREGESYTVNNFDRRWTAEQLKKEIDGHPEHFSPNVILRPMYQEMLLPNLAYIGGTNEIAYWLQLRAAFSRCEVFYPQLIVRDSALWIGKKTANELENLKIEPQLLLLPWKELENKFYELQDLKHASENIIENLLSDFEHLHSSLQSLPPEFIAPLIRQLNLQSKEVRKWKNEIHNKQLQLQESNIQKLKKIFDRLFPAGIFQERYENFIPYYLEYGDSLFDMLLENFEPSKGKLNFLIG